MNQQLSENILTRQFQDENGRTYTIGHLVPINIELQYDNRTNNYDYSFGTTRNSAHGNAISLIHRLGYDTTNIDFNMELIDQENTQYSVWIPYISSNNNMKMVLNRHHMEQAIQLPVSRSVPIDDTIE